VETKEGSESVAAKDSDTVKLTRVLTRLSGDRVTFQRQHKVALTELLLLYAHDEIVSAFEKFIENINLDDPTTLKYVAMNFMEAADALAHSARAQEQQRALNATLREAAVKRLQEEAERDRQEEDRKRQTEENSFDPLKD
jgi:hypothetical protein